MTILSSILAPPVFHTLLLVPHLYQVKSNQVLMQYIELDSGKKSTKKLEFSSTNFFSPQEAVTKDCLVQNILMKSSIVEPPHHNMDLPCFLRF